MSLWRSALQPIAGKGPSNFVEHFGWELPAVYTDTASEYRAATEGAAIHDVSYFGRLKATGKDVLDLLNRLSTNKVVSLSPGEGASTILTTDRGRILDVVYVVNSGGYVLLITSPGAQQTVIEWLDKYTIMEEVVVQDITASTGMVRVLGPDSERTLESATGSRLRSLAPFHSVPVEKSPHPPFSKGESEGIRIVRQHLADLPSFDIISSTEAAPQIWQHLVEAGLTPLGQEAYQAARISHGVPEYGRELGEAYNPLEAGLIGVLDFEKGCYIGQEVIARLDTYQKVQRALVKLRLSPNAALREGATLKHQGQDAGVLTSVCRIPSTGESMGLGYARKNAATVGTRFELAEVPGAWAEIEALPQLFGPGKDYG